MKMWQKSFLACSFVLLVPALSPADPGNNYCVTPAFITTNIKPNMLLMLDNSASMYDLAFVDRGNKHCAIQTAQSCSYDSDCTTAGDTCSVFTREPYYCYDETYRNVDASGNANIYTGYFDPSTTYYYNFPAGGGPNGEFHTTTSTIAALCPGATGETVKSLPSIMCVQYTTASGTVTKFAATGNYLNWLTASKLDIEKKTLTGGKWDGTYLIPESRGCVGQGYVKNALTTDFVNYTGTADNDPNTELGVTFTVTGPANANNATAPSSGGSTYINLYAGSVYNYQDCQDAVDALATGNNATIKTTVAACLSSTSPVTGYCQQNGTQSCTTSTDCVYNTGLGQSSFVCSANTAVTCTGTSDNTTCKPAAQNVCSGKNSISCTGPSDATSCVVTPPVTSGTCTGWSPALPNGILNKVPKTCSTPTCSYTYKSTTYTATCSGYSAPAPVNYGPCVNVSPDYGTCKSNYTGPCVLPGTTAQTKTKVSFQQSMQACWQLRNGHAIGTDDINTVINQCSDIYGSYKTCSNDHLHTCSLNADCTGGGTCQSGPQAIAPGNPALLCGSGYEGQYYVLSNGAWVLSSGTTTAQMIATHTQFCNDMSTPNVTDPTDAPSDTTVADNLPAIISGVGVEAQMGQPVGTMQVKIANATEPTGLVQEFGSQIRLGAMSFNPFGSASETSLAGMAAAKVCSNNSSQFCTQNLDCGTGNTCNTTTAGSTNLDGGRILYPIGRGYCATMSTVKCDAGCPTGTTCLSGGYCGTLGTSICTTVANCSGANQACIADAPGSHTTAGSLVKAIDDVKANTWTPLSEAFYNAIGYFAQTATGTSRTDLRLNSMHTGSTDFTGATDPPVDFNEHLNPSEFRCQQNYTLLVTDGSPTADRNTSVTTLSSLYATSAGITQVNCTGASGGSSSDYGGNNNLPILTWLAKNRAISDAALATTGTSTTPSNARDSITSFIVFNGESNGASGDCNTLTLMGKAATNGGTPLYKASKPAELTDALTKVFQNVAAKAASGTAASILSNSEGSGANILQAVFYPKKIFDNSTTADWIGEMQNLWYYVDPYINNSTIREDTDGPVGGVHTLNLLTDNVVRFGFDNSSNRTMVQLYQDTDGNGTGDTAIGGLIDPDAVKSIWRAGDLLWRRDLTTSPRTIYTPYIPGGTQVGTTGLMLLDYNNNNTATTLAPYLQAASRADAAKIMQYAHGFDFADLRPRAVKRGSIPANIATDPFSTGVGVWKLGDIISSTPRVQSTVRLGTYNLGPPGGYNDYSYLSFINSNQYQGRGMVYVGANDGMMHAFNLGVLSVRSSGFQKATLSGTNLGMEMWSFIPSNFLPYLNYLQDTHYKHLYAVDGKTLLVDASIGDTNTGSCVASTYYECPKLTNSSVVNASNNLDPTKNTWRTVLIGGMGLGGATSKTAGAATNYVTTPIADPADNTKGFGYSSYFALDISTPTSPQLLWEFSDPRLGYATSGPAIVRVGDPQTNGRWFAIFGSGPTGPIDTDSNQFQGRSNQNLWFFVVDLRTGELIQAIDTGIQNAFAGSMTGGAIDTDRWDPTVTGNYQDDAVYFGYVEKPTGGTAWTGGGVYRIMIDQVANPTNANVANIWHWGPVVTGIGPVTSAIAKLQDRKNRNLWLYGGTGRYFFRDPITLDDYSSSRAVFGIKDPCYNKGNIGNYLKPQCTDSISGSLVDQTTTIHSLSSSDPGWLINLDPNTTTVGAERLVTDSVALTNGTVYFTSFAPTMDACGYGGNSYLWGVKYDTGDQPPANSLIGKALIQLSTGEFKEVDLSTAFTDKSYRRMATPLTGKPPSDAPPVISSSTNKPLKKILHIQEH